ncbi:RadC family protein [Hyphobacterium marinum]|uniref:DNA repair protein RadC n=1 Tax=Hyphobacterium marinum TaxID=3116574 RepID=A0ABU7LZ69_9PROT|nr:DNA repair protein RadC [Hyphobacterium sp. Y6023]MEE2566862.1 DNA repair protein RadC [Hyphobacterium sp. Y6023]
MAGADGTPHHAGHRDRLRARFTSAGGDALADYELLELFLFNAIPRRDVKPLAKELIAAFGDLGGVAAAPIERLTEIKGVSARVAADLKLLQAISARMAREGVIDKPVVSSWSALVNYCRTALQHERTEQFRVLFLDKKNRLIADEIMSRGTVDHAPVFPREVVKRALAHEASAIILVHNHPSGDPTPSHSDVVMTKKMAEAAQPFDIVLHDHLVIGRETTASFKQLGLI